MRKVQAPLPKIIESHTAKVALIRRFAFHAHRLLPSLERNVRLAKRALNVLYVLLDIIDGSQLAITRVAGEGPITRRLTLRERHEGYIESILQTQTPLILSDREQHAQLKEHPVTRSYDVAAYIVVPLLNDQGIPVGLLAALDEQARHWNESDVASLHDCAQMISEMVAAEIASHKASPLSFLTQDALLTVSELLQEGIIVADRQNRLVYANQRITQLSGYASEELMTSPTWQQLTELEQDLQAKRCHEQRGQDCTTYVLELVRKDGSHWWAEIVNKPLYDTIGNPLGTIRLFRDITEQQQLIKQTLKLQRQDMIGQIALGITHDFNNLLTIVLGSTQLAMMEVTEDQQLFHDLTEIYQATNRASRITRQILTFARNIEFELSNVDINELMVDISRLLRRIVYAQIEIVPLLNPEAGFVEADAGYLEQLILNLALNARDLMPYGGKLFLETHAAKQPETSAEDQEETAQAYVGITIRGQANPDFGHLSTISNDTLEHIQLRFSIAKHIIEQHKGQLDYTQQQHDVSYQIRLPINDELNNPEDYQAGLQHLPRGNERILIVEHEPSMRRLLVRLLKMCDYDVEQAPNADDARQFLRQSQQPFDLIVTDTTLPYISGELFIQQLHGEYPHLKVLFTSSFHDNESIIRDYPSGQVMFLAKPFLLNDLAYKVRELLDS